MPNPHRSASHKSFTTSSISIISVTRPTYISHFRTTSPRLTLCQHGTTILYIKLHVLYCSFQIFGLNVHVSTLLVSSNPGQLKLRLSQVDRLTRPTKMIENGRHQRSGGPKTFIRASSDDDNAF